MKNLAIFSRFLKIGLTIFYTSFLGVCVFGNLGIFIRFSQIISEVFKWGFSDLKIARFSSDFFKEFQRIYARFVKGLGEKKNPLVAHCF